MYFPFPFPWALALFPFPCSRNSAIMNILEQCSRVSVLTGMLTSAMRCRRHQPWDSCGPAHGSCNGRTELLINRKSKSAPLVLPEGRGVEGGSLTRSASGWSLLKSQWTRQVGRKERLLNFRCQQLEGEGSHLSKDQLPPWQVGDKRLCRLHAEWVVSSDSHLDCFR